VCDVLFTLKTPLCVIRAKDNMDENIKILSHDELRHLLHTRYPDAEVILTDRNYAVLDPEWVEKEAYKAYINWISIFGFTRKIRNSFWKTNWDCEDMSASFKIYLRFLHAANNPNTFTDRYLRGKKNETNSDSVAVGTLFYKNSPTTGHAINVFVSPKGDLSYFEPKDGIFINITEAEEKKVWYVNF